MTPDVSFLAAFAAGVLSISSPCVLPLVPLYLTHLAGVSTTDAGISTRRRVLANATAYVLGFSLVFIAIGFASPVRAGLVEEAQVALDPRGNVLADDQDYRTSTSKVFVAGDMRRGQSLIVWAIREGRQAARAIDEHLMGSTVLPR